MSARVVRVVIFVLAIIMITSLVRVLLDPGLGKPEESRRTRHNAGFSICYPIGWGGSAFGSNEPGPGNSIRLAQERKTGRETTITAASEGDRPQTSRNAKEGTFQGQPAFYSTSSSGSGWQWRVQFQRDGLWYSIVLVTPIPLEVERSPYWPFIESFRVEKRITPATQGLPTIVPAQ